jgi:hypothetical protein
MPKLWAILCMSTRPNIGHAMGLVSGHQSDLGKEHWKVVKRKFRYLQGIKNMGLCFGLEDLNIVRYTNANFVGYVDDIKSTSGYVFLFEGTTISWLSNKQNCIEKSTMKAEYISCNIEASNAIWIKRFIKNLNFKMLDGPVNVFYDNKSHLFKKKVELKLPKRTH